MHRRVPFAPAPQTYKHRRLPVAKRRDADTRVAFSFAYFAFGEAKESESPAAATERHQDSSKCPALRSSTKQFGSGRFRVEAQIPRAFCPPCGCCASLRSEIVIRPQKPFSLTNDTRRPTCKRCCAIGFLCVQFDSCASPSIQPRMSAMYGCADSPSSRRQTSHSTLHCSLLMSARSTTRLDLLPWVCSVVEYTYCALSRCLMASASSACARPTHER